MMHPFLLPRAAAPPATMGASKYDRFAARRACPHSGWGLPAARAGGDSLFGRIVFAIERRNVEFASHCDRICR
jgi:hypothetical protein